MDRRIWLTIALLAVASLACSSTGGVGRSAGTRLDAAARVAEQAADVEPGELVLDAGAMEGLESYRTLFSASWEPQDGRSEVVTVVQEQTRYPSARRVIIEASADDLSVEIVQIADRSWMCSAGACGQIVADPDQLAATFLDVPMISLDDVLDGAFASSVGRERINGIDTRRYRLDLAPTQAALLAQGDISDVEGQAWVADEPDLPAFAVRFEISWVEKRQEVSGRAVFAFETYDVNAAFTIEPPQGAEASGLPDDVPLYPSAEENLSAPGVVRFRSEDNLHKVADAYRVGLSAEGWALERDDEIEGMVNQVWTKGARTLTLVASADGGGTTVIIAVEGDG